MFYFIFYSRSDIYKINVPQIRLDQLPEHISSVEISAVLEATKIPTEEIIDDSPEGRYFDFAEIKIRESCTFYETDLTYAFVNIRFVDILFIFKDKGLNC